MAKRSPNKENNKTEQTVQTSPSLGMEFMNELDGNKGGILECMNYIAEQFKCKARIDYDEQLRKDGEEFSKLDTDIEIATYVPTEYKKWRNNNYKLGDFKYHFDIYEWKIQKYDENVVKQCLDLIKKAKDYMYDYAKIILGTNRITTIGNSKLTGPNDDWLFWDNGKDSWFGYWGSDQHQWFKVFFSIALAMYVCSDGIKKVWKESAEGVEEVSSDLIDKVKGEATELIKKMGIKEPAESFFSDAEMFMCLLLTAFCIKDGIEDKEKDRIIKALIDHVKGEGTVIYKYRENLLKDVAKKNELLATADTIISDYYVLPTLNRINLENGRMRCKVEAPIGFGKTTFYRAIVTLMFRNHIIDERITAEKNKLDELEKKIRESWADIEFSNYFPIYVNALLINDKDKNYENLLKLAVGGDDYSDLIEQYARNDNGSKVMLIIDGLDEVNDSKQRIKLSELIDEFIRKYNNVNYIVSTRPVDLANYRNELNAGEFLNEIQKVTIDELSVEQKEAIIEKWVSVLALENEYEESPFERIKRSIENNQFLNELSENPFLLAYLVQLMINDVSSRPYYFINELVNELIKKKTHSDLRDRNRITDKDIRRILSFLAYDSITSKKEIDGDNLETVYEDAFDKVLEIVGLNQKDKNKWNEVFTEINTKAGLIVYNEDRYEFMSDTIRSFLAAEWMLLYSQYAVKAMEADKADREIRDIINKICENDNWEYIVIMMIVSVNKNNKLNKEEYFLMAIKTIIRNLFILGITTDKQRIIKLCRIFEFCCTQKYSNGIESVDEQDIKYMILFLNQNKRILPEDILVAQCNKLVEYNSLYDDGMI